MKNIEVKLEINSCDKCPFHKVTKSYSTDGWDRVEDWECKKVNKVIEKMIGTFEKVAIPKWCPYGENIEEVDVFEFLEKNNLELNFEAYLVDKKLRISVNIKHLDIKVENLLMGISGYGKDGNEALYDYISKVSNKEAVINKTASLENRKYINIPTLKFDGDL